MKLIEWLAVAAVASTILAGAAPAQPSGPNGNLPLSAVQMEERLKNEDFTISAVDEAGGGIMGAKKLKLVFATEPRQIEVKWKAAPAGGDGWNNSPRREIGAYVAQGFFLEPDDQVVPPVAARCIPLDVYRVVDPQAKPNIEGTSCVFGTVSAWLDNVKVPEKALDTERFSHDTAYARRFADANLFAYVVAHRDARPGNFLMSTAPDNPQLFSVDNGIAFGGTLYNFFVWHFDAIRVRGLQKEDIERLRHVTRRDLDALGVVGELQSDAAGVLRNVEPAANLDPEQGTRLRPGRIQFGLTAAEIDAIAARVEDLLKRVDAGELMVF
jgi:hypothetical protein